MQGFTNMPHTKPSVNSVERYEPFGLDNGAKIHCLLFEVLPVTIRAAQAASYQDAERMVQLLKSAVKLATEVVELAENDLGRNPLNLDPEPLLCFFGSAMATNPLSST